MTADDAVVPGPPKIFSGTTLASGATPATPMPLSFSAATVPETCVPWKLPCGLDAVVAVDVVPAQPVVDLAVGVVVDAVGLASEAALAGVAGELAGEVGVRQLDAGVDDRDVAPAPVRRRPRLGRVDVGVGACRRVQTDWPVLCRPHSSPNCGVVGLQARPAGPARRRATSGSALSAASASSTSPAGAVTTLGVGQRQRLVERDAGVLADVAGAARGRARARA